MKAASEVEVAGMNYRCGNLNAFQQFHITRRLGPALIVAGVSIETLRNGLKPEQGDLLMMAGPVMEFVAGMKDEDVNYVLRTCLGVVHRANGKTFAPVTTPDGDLMFDDIDMPVMLRLAFEVVKHNLAGFLQGLGGVMPTPSPSVPAP